MLFNINQWNIIEMAKITGFSHGIHSHFLSLEGLQEALPFLCQPIITYRVAFQHLVVMSHL